MKHSLQAMTDKNGQQLVNKLDMEVSVNIAPSVPPVTSRGAESGGGGYPRLWYESFI